MKPFLILITTILTFNFCYAEPIINWTWKKHPIEEDGSILYAPFGSEIYIKFDFSSEIIFCGKDGRITMTELLHLLRNISPEVCDTIWEQLKKENQ